MLQFHSLGDTIICVANLLHKIMSIFNRKGYVAWRMKILGAKYYLTDYAIGKWRREWVFQTGVYRFGYVHH